MVIVSIRIINTSCELPVIAVDSDVHEEKMKEVSRYVKVHFCPSDLRHCWPRQPKLYFFVCLVNRMFQVILVLTLLSLLFLTKLHHIFVKLRYDQTTSYFCEAQV